MSVDGSLFLALVVIALATYRLTRAWTTDALFEGTQARLEANFDDDGEIIPVVGPHGELRFWRTVAKDKVFTLLTCPYCVSMWVGLTLLCLWFEQWPWELGWHGWIIATAVAAGPSLLFHWEQG